MRTRSSPTRRQQRTTPRRPARSRHWPRLPAAITPQGARPPGPSPRRGPPRAPIRSSPWGHGVGDRWRVKPAPGGPPAWVLQSPDDDRAGTRLAFAAVDDRGRVWTWLDGRTRVVPPPEAGRPGATRPGRTARGPDALMSPMPATVTRVLVAQGDVGRAVDSVLRLEAMRMEGPLRAPHDGRVDEVRCRVGDLVPPGVPLVVLGEGGRT